MILNEKGMTVVDRYINRWIYSDNKNKNKNNKNTLWNDSHLLMKVRLRVKSITAKKEIKWNH